MSLASRLGRWWVRLTMKRKPPGAAALVDFTRRRFRTPEWIIKLHSLGMKIERTEAPVKGEWVSSGVASESERIIYYLHGGGYLSGSARSCRPITATLARQLDARVFSIDYRLAPEHPFPAGLDDVVAGYRWLISLGIDPRRLSVVGDSAGGGLALALVMRLRDSGERLPTCVVCLSPWTDMAGSSDSIIANSQRDPMFVAEDIERYASTYLGGESRHHPLASPLHGDFANLPAVLLQVGETEILLDDARAVHAKVIAAGGSSELRIFKGVPHGWHFGTPFVPEAREALREIAEFIAR